MFATALNLLPGGQLDGGHILFSVFPRLHKWVSLAVVIALIPLAKYCWVGWLIWAWSCGSPASIRRLQVAVKSAAGENGWRFLQF